MDQKISEIAQAIAALSFSAKIVLDADRLDGLGAIGIAHCFATAGLLKTESGRREGMKRVEVMKSFLQSLSEEIHSGGQLP